MEQAAQYPQQRREAALRHDVLSLALGLAAVLVAAKCALLPFPVTTAAEFARWCLRLGIVVSPDLCFVAALTTLSLLACRGAQAVPLLRRCARPGCFAVYYACGLYAVASISIYRWTMVPLTVPLLQLAGGDLKAGSSLAACLEGGSLLALSAGPLALLAAPWLTRRLPWFRRGAPLPWAVGIALLAVTVAYGATCRAYVRAAWTDPNRWERRIAQSPHVVLLASCFSQSNLSTMLADADRSDFEGTRRQPRRFDPLSGRRPRNVVLIVLESTGVEYLDAYGGRFETMPRLTRAAAQGGVVFENFYVQTPNSCKSLVALTAGIYPRLDWSLLVRDAPEFDVPTIAEVLKPHGYRSCFAHSGYWSWKQRDGYLRRRGADALIDAEVLPDAKVNSWGVADRAMYGACLDWIDQDPQQPFFLLAYTIETHHPYVARPPLHDFGVADEDFNRYLNALRAADENIAWLLDELRRRDLLDSTLVAVTADHGESFGQHNQRIHSFSLYESAVHVPLVLLHPGLPPGRAGAVRQQIDLAPTLLELLGIDPPPQWQGRSLWDEQPARSYFFATGNEVALGLRDGRYKYHYYVNSGHEELFDVDADPDELNNLATEHAALCDGYQRRLGGLVQFQKEFLR